MPNLEGYKVSSFRAPHAIELLKRPIKFDTGWFTNEEETFRNAQQLELGGPGYTLYFNNGIVGVAGVMILRPGVGEAWALMCEGDYIEPLEFHRAVSKMLNSIISEYGLRRVQATTAKENGNSRWLEMLGFKNETPEGLRQFGPNGETFFMYSIVRP
jgi:hypothetical protein